MKGIHIVFGGVVFGGVLLYLTRDKEEAKAPGASATPSLPAPVPAPVPAPTPTSPLGGLIPPNVKLPTSFPTLADVPQNVQQGVQSVLGSPEAQTLASALQNLGVKF